SASIGWLLVAQLIARRIWIAHAVMFPLYLVVGVDLYVISQYDTRLSSSMLLTIFENLEDAREYTEMHHKGMVAALVLRLAGYGYALWKIRDLRVTTPRLAPLVPLAGLVVVYAAVHHILIWWLFVVTNDRNSPFGIFPQTYATLDLYKQSLAEARQAQNFV